MNKKSYYNVGWMGLDLIRLNTHKVKLDWNLVYRALDLSQLNLYNWQMKKWSYHGLKEIINHF